MQKKLDRAGSILNPHRRISMRPAEGTHLLFLDDQGVLFYEPAQKLFHLNTTAAFIWCLLEEDKNSEEISAELQTTFAISAKTASNYLSETEELLQSLGVIQGFEDTSNSDAADNARTPLEPADYNDACFIEERYYHLLNTHLRVRFSDPAQIPRVDPILAHLHDNTLSEYSTTLDILADATGNIRLYRDRVPVFYCDDIIKLGPLAKSLAWQTAVDAYDFFIDIHAGVVGDGEHCLLLPAAPGSGKSTLTAALVHHGFEYFSDEIAMFQEENMEVCPAPLAICVKDTATEVLSRYYPQLPELCLHLRGDEKWARYMPPPPTSIPPTNSLRPVGAIIFPRYKPGETTLIEELPPAEAVESLMRECLIVDTHLDREKVSSLLKWIDRTPCYRLQVSDLEEAVDLLRALSRKITNSPKSN
ncbi:MAG: PqqD family peptide modification chaperone [Sedimenticola sp.]